jgi:hypothetical protein
MSQCHAKLLLFVSSSRECSSKINIRKREREENPCSKKKKKKVLPLALVSKAFES